MLGVEYAPGLLPQADVLDYLAVVGGDVEAEFAGWGYGSQVEMCEASCEF